MTLEGNPWKLYSKFVKVRFKDSLPSENLLFSTEEERHFVLGKDFEEDEDDDPINPLVDALFDEIEHLRLQVCAPAHFRPLILIRYSRSLNLR